MVARMDRPPDRHGFLKSPRTQPLSLYAKAIRYKAMARTYLTFGDIAGKLHMLRIECTRCERKSRYIVAKLVAQYGRSGNMSKWVSDLRRHGEISEST